MDTQLAGVFKTRVNGAFLPNFVGKPVVLLGSVVKAHPSGSAWELKTTDNRLVTVNMKQHLDSSLSGYVEVHGIVKGKTFVECDTYINFPEALTENFDCEAYNEAVNIIHATPNPWKD